MSIINLLPRDYLKRRLERRNDVILTVLFALVMAGVISATAMSERSWDHTVNVAEQVDKSYAQAAQLIEQLQHLEEKKNNVLQRAEQTASLMERVPRSYLLATVTNALPPDASMTSFHLTTERIEQGAAAQSADAGESASRFQAVSAQRFPGEVVARVKLEVSGLAGTDVDVARFMSNMSVNPLVESVDLVYSEERLVEDDTPVRAFQVTVCMKPGADVIDALDADQSAAPAVGAKGRNERSES